MTGWKPRLSIEITETQALKLRNYIPYSMRGKVMRIIIEDLIELMEAKGPDMVVAALVSRMINVENIIKDVDYGDDRQSEDPFP